MEENQESVKRTEDDLKAANQALQTSLNNKRTLMQQKDEINVQMRAKREELETIKVLSFVLKLIF